jgi:ABC-type Fe3+ transport system substrate-binding protein
MLVTSLRTALSAPSVLIVTLAFAGTSAGADTIDELYAKAKAERSLTIYAGGPVASYEPLARDFERAFPGITVAIEAGFSNVLNQKIERQFAQAKLLVDIGLFQTVQDFVRWKGEGRLLAFEPEGAATIDLSHRDPGGAFIAWNLVPIAYAYNSKEVAPENVPKSALDFVKPAFRGKMITCYPHDDDATLYLFRTILRKYGDDYLDKYVASQPNWVQGHLNVSRSVAAGTNLVTPDATISTVMNLKKAGQPIELAFSNVDPIPVFYSTAGIFKGAPHPNAAKLYLTWLLAPEQQRRIGTFSPRRDVPAPAGLKPLGALNLANGYREFVTDERLLADMRQRFERAVGPIRNTGGVR